MIPPNINNIFEDINRSLFKEPSFINFPSLELPKNIYNPKFDAKFDINTNSITIPVQNYEPEDIKVSIQNDIITIQGDSVKEDGNNYSKNSFVQRFSIPKHVAKNSIVCNFTKNKELKINYEIKEHENIPIEYPM